MAVPSSTPPEGFPATIELRPYFLEALRSDGAIMAARIIIILIFLAIIIYWLYLEYKNRPEGRR